MTEPTENKKKTRIPRTPMPEQDPKLRGRIFEEVPFGYNPALAKLEASRCLQCKKPACVPGCPVSIDIPGFIWLILQEDFRGAAWKLKEMNSLPAVCVCVCSQENQCEKVFILGKKGDPVAIGHLERFAADFDQKKGEFTMPPMAPPTGKKVLLVEVAFSGGRPCSSCSSCLRWPCWRARSWHSARSN